MSPEWLIVPIICSEGICLIIQWPECKGDLKWKNVRLRFSAYVQRTKFVTISLQAFILICGWLMVMHHIMMNRDVIHCQDVKADCLDILIICSMGI